MTVATPDVMDKMLTLGQARERISATEPLGVHFVDSDGPAVSWKFDPEWAFTLDSTHGTERVKAYVTVQGTEYELSKDAVLTAASAFGLPGSHAKQLPAHLMEAEMNYWFGAGMGNKAFNVLTTGDDLVAGFIKPTRTPFSNVLLLDKIESAVRRRIGGADIKVDYKFNHSLRKTDIRLVLPTLDTIIDSAHENDEWFGGIHISNSLLAAAQTSIEPYLFRYICTNGATTEYGDKGRWNRRTQGQNVEDVMLWAQRSVDEIFDTLPQRWAELQKLTEVKIEGNAEAILREVFKTYGVPYTQQNEVLSTLAEVDDLNMYELMQSITELANDPNLKPERADSLMRIGGAIPTSMFDPLNSKLWDEGHTASPDAKNPYEIVV